MFGMPLDFRYISTATCVLQIFLVVGLIMHALNVVCAFSFCFCVLVQSNLYRVQQVINEIGFIILIYGKTKHFLSHCRLQTGLFKEQNHSLRK